MANLQGKKVCVACSGGVDSTALLHYLLSHKNRVGYTLCAVHCEHGLRGDASLADMQFVRALCARWGVELKIFQEDCRAMAKREKCSEETAGRMFRRRVFAECVSSGYADCIATAHHQNDEAETVLFRLARGSALGGAGGMHETDGYVVRPFLRWSRAEIERYVKEHGLAFCTDETNGLPCATRNRIRNEVLPILEDAVPGASGALARFARLAAEDDALLQTLSDGLYERTSSGVNVTFSDTLPLFRRACVRALKELGVEKDYTAVHLEALAALQHAERGARVDMPKGVVAVKKENAIAFSIKQETQKEAVPLPKKFTLDGFDGGRYAVNLSMQPPVSEETVGKTLKIDLAKMPTDAVFRFRRDGDELTKFGGGTKRLKKFFNERKIPTEERAYVPLIASETGQEVYAVCGVEIAERLKIDENTQSVVYIFVQKK